jgi:phage major head subunit gpT-like protein
MDKITSRQVIGWFYQTLNSAQGAPWINQVSNYFTSDQDIEEYYWLGMVPAMREWIGGRQAKGLKEQGIQIKNRHFEGTLEFLVKHMRRDKSGQIKVRIQELAKRANTHWASLLSQLILLGESQLCYDGQYFFDSDHKEGDSGTQSNLVSVDISSLPASTHGEPANPSVEEMQLAIARAVAQIVSFRDNAGEPMNEDATQFLVMTPISLMNTALNAVATPSQVAASQTALEGLKQNFSISVTGNARLSAWSDKFTVFRTDSFIKSFIRQEETGAIMKAKAEGSEYEFDNDAHQYGVDSWRNVGYGYWQNSCLIHMV